MKIFSILYASQIAPGKQAMSTTNAVDIAEAYRNTLTSVKELYGDLMWMPMLTTTLDTAVVDSKNELIPSTVMALDELKDSKNFLMKTIIDNKDETLFRASEKYLNQSEIQFIKNKTDWTK